MREERVKEIRLYPQNIASLVKISNLCFHTEKLDRVVTL